MYVFKMQKPYRTHWTGLCSGKQSFFTRVHKVDFWIELKCQTNNSTENFHPNEGGGNLKYMPPCCWTLQFIWYELAWYDLVWAWYCTLLCDLPSEDRSTVSALEGRWKQSLRKLATKLTGRMCPEQEAAFLIPGFTQEVTSKFHS